MDVIGVILTFAPLILILWLANLGQRLRERSIPHMTPVIVSYVFLIMFYLFFVLFGFVTLMGNFAARTRPDLLAQFTTGDANPLAQVNSWDWLSLGTLLPSIAGLILLLKPVRRFCTRFTSLDAEHPVHAVALSMTMLPIISLAMALGIGLGNLSVQIAEQSQATGTPAVPLIAVWTQAAMFLLMALIGVGWLSRRSFGAALARLGIVRPTLREVLIGIGLAAALVPIVMLFEAGMSAVGLGVDQDVESLMNELVGPLLQSPWGVLSIGLAAAIGEEPIFRGALQPRFGLVFSAVLFALVHSQYGISLATLVVLGLGLVLGWERKRYNTTTTIITHALYNSLLAGVALVAAQVLGQQ
jgi:membrane protease YdiL (CAAX protease family)